MSELVEKVRARIAMAQRLHGRGANCELYYARAAIKAVAEHLYNKEDEFRAARKLIADLEEDNG